MRVREFFRHFWIYFTVCVLSVGLYVMVQIQFLDINEVQAENIEEIELFGRSKLAFVVILSMSLMLATFSSLLDIIILKPLTKRRRLWLAMSVGFVAQTLLLFFVVHRTIHIVKGALETVSNREIDHLNTKESIPILIVLIFTTILARIFIEVDKQLGPGNLWKIVTGRFYNPSSENRIFMFIDMHNSTPIAEQLGHMKYSRLIQDAFKDLAIVDKYRAQIYQYVGDEVVLTWKTKCGLSKENCLHAYFAFQDRLEARSEYYISRYGLVPFFKCGVHEGPIVVTEVGDLKREITYHGDTINTTSRIQGMCNELEAKCLMSSSLYDSIVDQKAFDFEDVGDVTLKGKERQVRLFKVKKPAKDYA
jgi:adenylate cyclase